MNIQPYANTKGKVCWICHGRGCSTCNKTGVRQQQVHVISEEALTQQHLQIQQRLKDVGGRIVFDEEDEKDEETKKLDNQ